DADVREPIEQIAALVALHDPLDDVADGRPCHTHQLPDGGLVAALREVADLILERPREPGSDVGPRHVLDDDAAARAVDASRVIAQVPAHPREVEVPPPAALDAIVAGAVVAAAGAARRAPGGRDVDHEAIVDERATADAGVFQPEQVGE